MFPAEPGRSSSKKYKVRFPYIPEGAAAVWNHLTYSAIHMAGAHASSA